MSNFLNYDEFIKDDYQNLRELLPKIAEKIDMRGNVFYSTYKLVYSSLVEDKKIPNNYDSWDIFLNEVRSLLLFNYSTKYDNARNPKVAVEKEIVDNNVAIQEFNVLVKKLEIKYSPDPSNYVITEDQLQKLLGSDNIKELFNTILMGQIREVWFNENIQPIIDMLYSGRLELSLCERKSVVRLAYAALLTKYGDIKVKIKADRGQNDDLMAHALSCAEYLEIFMTIAMELGFPEYATSNPRVNDYLLEHFGIERKEA